MKDLNITINANTRQPKFTRNFIGVNGEYLNGNIIVDFEDEFIEGMATFEVQIDEDKYLIAMERGADDYYYSLQIKSSLLAKAGKIYCQVRIDTIDDQVFKCRRFPLFVLEAINATSTIPEDYKDVIQQIEEQINEIKSDYVPNTRRINNKSLESDVNLTPSDIGAEPTISAKGSAFNKDFEDTDANILMDGTADAGTSNKVARADHRHPSDSTKQNLITNSNKLSSDLVDDNNQTNKFVTETEKTTWNNKQNALTPAQLSAINSGITSALVGQITENAEDIEDLKNDKQDAITSSNKLNADLLQDGSTNKTVTATEKSTWNGKQDQLQSGVNIKTVNNESLLGSGNITVGGGQSTDVQVDSNSITQGDVANIKTKNGNYNANTNKFILESDLPTIDSSLSTTSENPVQNKVITNEINKKLNEQETGSTTSGGYTTQDTSSITHTSLGQTMQLQRSINDSAGADYEYLFKLFLDASGINFYSKKGSGTTYSGIMIGAISEVGTGYIRFTTGLQICWGTTTGSGQTKAISFAKAFKSGTTPIVTTGIKNSGTGTTQRTVTVSNNLSNTGFNAILSASTDFQCHYIAIGQYQ